MQAQLKKSSVAKLKAAVPALSKDDLEVMQEVGRRRRKKARSFLLFGVSLVYVILRM